MGRLASMAETLYLRRGEETKMDQYCAEIRVKLTKDSRRSERLTNNSPNYEKRG